MTAPEHLEELFEQVVYLLQEDSGAHQRILSNVEARRGVTK